MVAPGPAPLTIVETDDSSKRRQILDGARAVFMDRGFDGASMGEIARAAGVSKGTLYVYFADKNRLFEAIVEQECLEQGHTAFNFDPSRDPETTLWDFGRAFIQVLCRPEGGSSLRTVMAIAERKPEVGRRFYEEVIALTHRRFADYLDSQCAAGTLKIDDTMLAEFAVVAPVDEVVHGIRARCDGLIDRVLVGFPPSIDESTVVGIVSELQAEETS